MKYVWLLCGLCFGVTLAQARTLIVAADSSEEFLHVAVAADSAQAGDTVLIRDGGYEEFRIDIDSAVVVVAEHPGQVQLWDGGSIPAFITLTATAKLCGVGIFGNFAATGQTLVFIEGGPATLYNCGLRPDARWGTQVGLACAGQAPLIRYCNFWAMDGASPIVRTFDSTYVWMPQNYYYGTADTTVIHQLMVDFSPPHIFVSPVMDTFHWLSAPEHAAAPPLAFSLSAYPNPFNPVAVLSFSLARQSRVTLQVFNVGGREIQTLADQPYAVGEHRIAFDGSALASGVYFARLKAQGLQQTTKLVLMR